MQNILVTPEMISDAANSCDITANDLSAELAALKSYVMELQAVWQGVASLQFNQLMTNFDIYARMLNDSLTDIAQGLRGNAVNYVDSEIANINSLVAVNGDIPGARL